METMTKQVMIQETTTKEIIIEGTNNPENNNQTNTSGNNENKEELPETLPKTGTTQYIYVITAIAVLGATYIAVKNIKEDKKQNK